MAMQRSDLKTFSAGNCCPKCCTLAPGAKYCQMVCLAGPDEHGKGQYLSELPACGAPPLTHLHRVCRACGFEWLEACADDPGAPEDPCCSFCCRPRSKLLTEAPPIPMMSGPQAQICIECLGQLNEVSKRMQLTLGQPKPGAAATH